MAEAPRAGFFRAFKTLLVTLLATGRTRLELLSVELQEEKLRLIDLIASALIAVFALGLALVLTLVFLTLAFWEQRLLILGGATGLCWLALLLLYVRIRGLTARPSPLFKSSLAELDKDLATLRGPAP